MLHRLPTSSSLFHRHTAHLWMSRSAMHARASSFSTSFPFFSSTKKTTTTTTETNAANAAEGAPSDTEQQAPVSEAELREQFKATQAELLEKSQKLTQVLANYHRALADAENLRTRAKRDVEQAHLFALQSFAKDLLTIADTLALALTSVSADALQAHAPLKQLHEGLANTSDAFHATLHRFGVQRIEAVEGDTFQPNLHHALFQVPQPNRVPGTLHSVLKAGYLLNGRVLRPAQVSVVQETTSTDTQAATPQSNKDAADSTTHTNTTETK